MGYVEMELVNLQMRSLGLDGGEQLLVLLLRKQLVSMGLQVQVSGQLFLLRTAEIQVVGLEL